MKKLSIAVALSAGMIHGCADSTVAFEQSKLMPGNGQVVSLTGTESEAVMTLTTRRKEYVFEGRLPIARWVQCALKVCFKTRNSP